ncbi:MAG: cob(I)yrinic acid a,c-diamide adenosyltransferase [Candidatus Omnitrophica bacterium]|nr:cob(I)yrinic acid a,c-diamide adenosyltransferase [Candidatus Omnitrophota bacterium]
MFKKGLIHVYTGCGKGKTTAAMGLALRAAEGDLKVCYMSFHKNCGGNKCGGVGMLKKVGISVYGFAEKSICAGENFNKDEIRDDCLKGLEAIKVLFKENKYDVLILDEIIISAREGFLKENEILDLMESKPARLELVLTGRDASENIIKKADLVSEIKKIKHPYDTGEKPRQGIEY